MDKRILIAVLIIVAVVAIFSARLFTNEDSWICQNGQWIKHGNPSAPMPTSGCGDNNQQQQQQQPQPKEAEIIITMPQAEQIIHGPFAVEGKARGSWFFEGVFPIKLLDGNGKEITRGQAHATGEWMTQDFVPFSAELDFKAPTTATGTLIFHNDNPSGLPANDKEFRVSLRFK